MAARIDFDYLHRIASGPESHGALRRIEADRERLLSGASLETPGERLDLTLVLGPDEIGTDRSQTAQPPHRKVHLCLRSDLAPASMDAILEIFRDHAHTVLPGFRGETGGTVVDLGANEGFYTLKMKLRNPAIQIVAAEPVRENAERFRENMAANSLAGITLRETAITDRSGDVHMETLPHVGTVASTDMLAFPRPWIDAEKIRHRTVPAMSLATLLETTGVSEAEILKMDIEGSETTVLAGSSESLRRFRRVVVECHGDAARTTTAEIMESQGFRSLHAESKRSGDLYFLRT